MNLPAKLTTYGTAYVLDGGSILLNVRDEHGRSHEIFLAQNAFLHSTSSMLPGRLYFNKTLVEIRSEDEARLMSLLRESVEPPLEASVPTPLAAVDLADPDRVYVSRVVHFVESDEYLRIPDQLKRTEQERERRQAERNVKLEKLVRRRRRGS